MLTKLQLECEHLKATHEYRLADSNASACQFAASIAIKPEYKKELEGQRFYYENGMRVARAKLYRLNLAIAKIDADSDALLTELGVSENSLEAPENGLLSNLPHADDSEEYKTDYQACSRETGPDFY